MTSDNMRRINAIRYQTMASRFFLFSSEQQAEPHVRQLNSRNQNATCLVVLYVYHSGEQQRKIMPQTPSTRETLRFLLNQHGIGLCFSVEKCRMLLMENCLGHKREIDLLATAIEQEITSEILRLKKAMPVSILLPKLTRWLTHKTEGSDEDCRWVVDSWAMALGIIPFCECELSNPELNQVGCHPHFTN